MTDAPRVDQSHIVAKLSAIYFTKRAARYTSQRGFELKWEASYHLSWLVKSVHAKALPLSPIFWNRLGLELLTDQVFSVSKDLLPRYPSQRISASHATFSVRLRGSRAESCEVEPLKHLSIQMILLQIRQTLRISYCLLLAWGDVSGRINLWFLLVQHILLEKEIL